MIMPFIVLYVLDAISLGSKEWGLISTIETITILAFRVPGGIITDRYNKRLLLLIGSLWNLGYFIAFIFSKSFLQLLTIVILRRIVITLTDPAWPALQIKLIPKEQRGRIFSILNVLVSISGFIGSMVGGYLFDINPSFPFWLFIPFNVMEFLVLYFFIR